MVSASDSRTNAGADQASIYGKMHTFGTDGDRAVCVLTSGTLATSQAVLRQLRRERRQERLQPGDSPLDEGGTLAEVVDHIGALSVA